MADGRLIVGTYAPYTSNQQGKVVVGSYVAYPITAHGKVVIGSYEPYEISQHGKLIIGSYAPYEVQHGKVLVGFYGDTPPWGSLVQTNIDIIEDTDYKLTFKALNFVTIGFPGTLSVKQGTQEVMTFTTSQNGNKSVIFTADNSGNSIGFYPNILVTTGAIDNVSLRVIKIPSTNDNIPVKEFLIGETDEGREIIFRADTQILQVQTDPEMYSVPVSVVTESERGINMKTFASLDDRSFYEIEGTVKKGVSVLKFSPDSTDKNAPPMVQSIQISYRDSSPQLCRIIQSTIITMPTSINHSE